MDLVAVNWLVLLACVAILLLTLLGGGIFALIKLGVIVKEASRPRQEDRGSYTLDQGREVRPEQEGDQH